jgi:uncharacterized membrane protein YvbJ
MGCGNDCSNCPNRGKCDSKECQERQKKERELNKKQKKIEILEDIFIISVFVLIVFVLWLLFDQGTNRTYIQLMGIGICIAILGWISIYDQKLRAK